MNLITPKELSDFEKDIQAIYEGGSIRGPVHLRDNNEGDLYDIFQNVKKEDFVFSTWGSHLHALLKGVPPEEIKKKILDGKSITLHFPKHHFYSSAIVGGICPIAVGTAWGCKSPPSSGRRVYCFIGDMTFLTGIASESIRYSLHHDLPITWVVEDNGVSVGTDTEKVWNSETYRWFEVYRDMGKGCENFDIIYYKFNMSYPHSGTGVFVEF
jgi:TPP-dependent pyruvate/acetoin dehydrogenase alpha subunit